MPVTALMQQFVEDELDAAAQTIERTRGATLTLLRNSQDFGAIDALTRRGSEFAAAFVDSLRRQSAEALAAAGEGTAPVARSTEPQLADEARVEIDIAIARAMQLVDTTAEWELRELQTYTSTLVGLTHVSADSHVLRPLAYATALWDATGALACAQPSRLHVLSVGAGVMAGLLKTAWAAACTRLESLGVEPSVYRTVLLARGTVTRTAPRTRRPTSAFAALLADAPVPSAVPGGMVRAGLQTPSGVRADEYGVRVAELVSRLFRAFAVDDGLGAGVRTVLAHWHDPLARLALRDEALLEGLDHPAWRVLDRIARIGDDLAEGGPRQRRLLALATQLAGDAAATPGLDAEPYRRALRAIDELAAEQWQEQLHGAQGAVEQLARIERRDALEHRLAERLAVQLAEVRTTPSIRRFVTGAWARVVAQAMVEHEEADARTARYVRAADDLLWSLSAPAQPAGRQRLLGVLPGLLETLRDGMQSIGMAASEQQALFDELMPIHTEALRPRGAAGSGALTPQQIVQRLRDEVIEAADAPRRFGDSVIDVASMETVPAELLPNDAAPDATPPELLTVGAVRRLFVNGRWTHAQLLWRSEQGHYLLFAGEGAGRTHAVTRRALERLQAAHLVRPVEQRPLVARTLETLMHRLSLT